MMIFVTGHLSFHILMANHKIERNGRIIPASRVIQAAPPITPAKNQGNGEFLVNAHNVKKIAERKKRENRDSVKIKEPYLKYQGFRIVNGIAAQATFSP